MALLLNGINVSRYILAGSFKRAAPLVTGERRRAFGGGMRQDVIQERQAWTGRTVPLTPELAAAFRGLLEGRGDGFAFDSDQWSTRGAKLTLGTGSVLSGTAQLGANSLLVDAPNESTADLSDIIGSAWTMFGWRRPSADGAFAHWIFRDDGTTWKNGASDSLPVDPTLTAGVLSFDPSTDTRYDDWCVVPYRVPSAWVAELYAEHTARSIVANLLKPRATGSALPATRNVCGQISNTQHLACSLGGVWTPNAAVLDFTIEDA